ncbi:MAG: hypothetical protein WB682_07350 [Candidatus Dormiibacterota bacterium]
MREVPAAVRPTLQAARRTIKAVAPAAVEVAYQGVAPRSRTFMWKIARYTVDGANVVGIGTYSGHSNLFFYRGRELDDGSGLLKGGGKGDAFHHPARARRCGAARGQADGAEGVRAGRRNAD